MARRGRAHRGAARPHLAPCHVTDPWEGVLECCGGVDPMSVHSVAEIHFAWIDVPIVIQRGAPNRPKHHLTVGILTCAVFATALES